MIDKITSLKYGMDNFLKVKQSKQSDPWSIRKSLTSNQIIILII